MSAERAYVSVVRWPEGWDESRRTDVIEKTMGVDRYRARDWARRGAPAMLMRCELDRGEKIAEALRALGVGTVAVHTSALAAGLKAQTLRTVARRDGAYELTPLKGPPVELPFSRILALVRGHLRCKGAGDTGDFGVQALHQLHGTFSAQDWDQGVSAHGRLHVVEVLDVHDTDDHQWRIIGGRCTFSDLPGPGAISAREAVDHAAHTLSADAGGLLVDQGFDRALFVASFLPDFHVNGDWRSSGGFSIYSAWVARLLLAERKA